MRSEEEIRRMLEDAKIDLEILDYDKDKIGKTWHEAWIDALKWVLEEE